MSQCKSPKRCDSQQDIWNCIQIKEVSLFFFFITAGNSHKDVRVKKWSKMRIFWKSASWYNCLKYSCTQDDKWKFLKVPKTRQQWTIFKIQVICYFTKSKCHWIDQLCWQLKPSDSWGNRLAHIWWLYWATMYGHTLIA